MASVSYEEGKRRWRVQWWISGGPDRKKTSRRFKTEAEAREFVLTITNEYRGGGVSRNGRRRTPEQVLDFIAGNFVIDESGCWLWTNTLTKEGYGRLTWKQSDDHQLVSGAHRLAVHVAVEPVPSDMVTDHLCRNRACVNPDHLDVVTQRENVMRSPIAPGAINAKKTHCPQGHPYSPENTYVYTFKTRKTTTRVCKTCQRAYHRRYNAAKKAGAAA